MIMIAGAASDITNSKHSIGIFHIDSDFDWRLSITP